jgi:hypothetical protein
MTFATDMQQVATELLTEFDERPVGGKIQLQKNSSAVWDEILAEDVITPVALIDLTGVAVPYSQSLVNDTTIQSGDIKLTVTMATEPLAQDKVILDGVEHSIVSINPFAYTGKPLTIAYAIQIRR